MRPMHPRPQHLWVPCGWPVASPLRAGTLLAIVWALQGCGATGLQVACPPHTTLQSAPLLASCREDAVDGYEGLRHGPYLEVHTTGAVRRAGTYSRGARSGEWQRIDRSGSVRARGAFERGNQVGKWTYTNAIGKVFIHDWSAKVAPTTRKEQEEGGCNKADISQRVKAQATNLRNCYQHLLARKESATGSLMVQWTIGSNGWVWWLDTVRDTVRDDAMRQCVEDVIADIDFEPPTAGVCVIQWPFVFTAGP